MNLRDYERESIRAFVRRAADDGYLSGRVLDYGCGRQPYRDIVEEAGGTYEGFDRAEYGGALAGVGDVGADWQYRQDDQFDSILCTQVVQYLPVAKNPGYAEHIPFIFHGWAETLTTARLHGNAGWLVLTYPTNWPEVEAEDLHRFTKAGMERLLTEAGFEIVRHERRGTLYDARFPSGREKRITATADEFAIGYGVVARA